MLSWAHSVAAAQEQRRSSAGAAQEQRRSSAGAGARLRARGRGSATKGARSMSGRWAYTQGLHDLGNATYAYLQPDGGWGWSNAGLIVDGDEALLIDTLFDLRLTGEMLDTMRRQAPAARHIGTV